MKRVWSSAFNASTVHSYSKRPSKRIRLQKDVTTAIAQQFPIQPLISDVWNLILSYMLPEEATILKWVCKYFHDSETFLKLVSNGRKPKHSTLKRVCKEAIIGTGNVKFVRSLPITFTARRLRIIRDRAMLHDNEFPLFIWVIRQGVGMNSATARKIVSNGSDLAFNWLISRPPGLYWDDLTSLFKYTLEAKNPDRFNTVLNKTCKDVERARVRVSNICTYTLQLPLLAFIIKNAKQYGLRFTFDQMVHALFRSVRLDDREIFATVWQSMQQNFLSWKALLQDYVSNGIGELNPLCAALYYGHEHYVSTLLPHVTPDGDQGQIATKLLSVCAVSNKNNVGLLRMLVERFADHINDVVAFENPFIPYSIDCHPANTAYLSTVQIILTLPPIINA